MKNKKGESQLREETIFILANLVFFGAMIFFITASFGGAKFYEQVYAKQIALTIDSAKINTSIAIDMQNVMKYLKTEEAKKNAVKFEANRVVVNFGSANGYGYKFFTQTKVKSEITNNRFLYIKLEEL